MGRRGYWRVASERAWREAVAAAPWSSKVKLVCAIGAAGAATLVGWRQSGEVATGGIWGLAVIVAVTVGTFLFKLWWAVPADLAAEADKARDEMQTTLDSYVSPVADATFQEGIGFIHHRGWGWGDDVRGNPNSWVLAEEIAERAHRGEIHIWGKCPPTARHSPIPPDHWRLEAVAMESLCNEASEVKTSKRGPLAKDRYWHLMINRAEFEREWPRNA